MESGGNYYIRILENFPTTPQYDWVASQPLGFAAIVFYINLSLRARNTDGRLITRLEVGDVPATIEDLHRVSLPWASLDDARKAMELLLNAGYIGKDQNVYTIKNFESMVGSTSEASRKRAERRRRQAARESKTSDSPADNGEDGPADSEADKGADSPEDSPGDCPPALSADSPEDTEGRTVRGTVRGDVRGTVLRTVRGENPPYIIVNSLELELEKDRERESKRETPQSGAPSSPPSGPPPASDAGQMEIFNQSAPKTSKSRKKAKQPAPEAVECGEPVFWMPAKDQDDMYPLFQKDIDAWAKEFPTLDVMEELRKMLERAENPMETARQGRKVYDPRYLTTYRGVKNGVRNWLKKGVSFQQERAARRQQIPKPAGAPSGGEVPDTRQPWQIARDAEWERNHPDYRPIEGNPFDTILGPAPEEEILPKDEDEQAPPPVSTAEAADGSAWVYGRGEKPDADTLWRRAHPDLAAMLDRNRAEEQEQKQARAEQAAGGQISTRESEQPAAEPETGPDGDDEEIECPF